MVHFSRTLQLKQPSRFKLKRRGWNKQPATEPLLIRAEREEVGCAVVTHPLDVFASVAVVLVDSCPWRHGEQHFYAAPCPEERRERSAGESRGSQLTSAVRGLSQPRALTLARLTLSHHPAQSSPFNDKSSLYYQICLSRSINKNNSPHERRVEKQMPICCVNQSQAWKLGL